jgi:hypothetical protein
MTYTKPDIRVLGDAAELIQGGGTDFQEPTAKGQAGGGSAGELDD